MPAPRQRLAGRQPRRPSRASRRLPRCPLWERATQTVFGEGPPDAPADVGRRAARRPGGSRGPALRRSRRAAARPRAGGSRHRPRSVYVTNAVKHFKFEPRGKRRMHQRPRLRRDRACRSWYERELVDSPPASWWRWVRPPRNACSAKSRPASTRAAAGQSRQRMEPQFW